ncbi:hypothetical protein [Pseudonocardia acaciae]|uniref:hypothetical protein n=1 Tax=Pseudonocardia acaciae TaxID=551276 RepID=UPI00048BC8F4|nr:hypothetical protein [Pseudonocardia acaciae]
MTTPQATAWQEIGDLTGPAGAQGAPGTSITGAAINTSGDLIVTLSTGEQINAGRAKGERGGGIDFESSVPTVADLPATAPYGEARYVQANGHLYVFEADGGGAGVDGWTDVGAIRGATGDTGPQGAPGRGVTAATVDAAGHLVLTWSDTGPADVGVVKGADGAPGTNGADGAPGERGTDVIAYPAGSVPAASGYRVGTIAIGGDGKLLRAIA